MRDSYGMYTAAGDRLIANRVNTVRKKLDEIKAKVDNKWDTEAQIKNAIVKGIKGYANMKSKAHPEYDDTAVREMVLGEFTKMYASAMGVERREAYSFIDDVWYSVR